MNKLGFGFLRLPMCGADLDEEALNAMVDTFLSLGGTYFDTAYTYLDGKSEDAIRRCLTSRHPRESYRLASKLPGYQVKEYADCRKFFAESCRRCGVDYFDVYMLHWLNRKHYEIAEKTGQFAFLQELKANGEARLTGFSYHDSPELLDEILTAHPELDCVLLQINYLDWEDPAIASRRCYETALRHGKQILVMEPVKGGTLSVVSPEAGSILQQIDPDATPSALALRFAQSLDGVHTVLSGMSTLSQMRENMADISPMTPGDMELLQQAAKIIDSATKVPCTGCGYCISHCPVGIPIPQVFRLYNSLARHPGDGWKIAPAYVQLLRSAPDPHACIGCHSCEGHCPQKVNICDHLHAAVQALEG